MRRSLYLLDREGLEVRVGLVRLNAMPERRTLRLMGDQYGTRRTLDEAFGFRALGMPPGDGPNEPVLAYKV